MQNESARKDYGRYYQTPLFYSDVVCSWRGISTRPLPEAEKSSFLSLIAAERRYELTEEMGRKGLKWDGRGWVSKEGHGMTRQRVETDRATVELECQEDGYTQAERALWAGESQATLGDMSAEAEEERLIAEEERYDLETVSRYKELWQRFQREGRFAMDTADNAAYMGVLLAEALSDPTRKGI